MKKLNWKAYIPFLLLGAFILLLHIRVEFNVADDLFFQNITKQQAFHLPAWLQERYMTWSSRTMIEGLMMTVLSLPIVVWRVIDSLLMVVIFIIISLLFYSEEHLLYKNACLVLLGLTVTWELFGEAGWVATTLNYIWPLAFGLITVYSIKRCMIGKKLRLYEYIVYSICTIIAVNSEQICIMLMLVFGGAICVQRYKGISSKKYIIVQMSISILGLLNIIASPGNKVRVQEEIVTWYPEYGGFHVFQKIELGIATTLKTLFLQQNLWLVLFLLLLCIAIWMKYEDYKMKCIAVIPLLGVVSVNQLCRARGDGKWPANAIGSAGISRTGGMSQMLNIVTCVGFILLCILILASIYLLFEQNFQTVIMSGVFIYGLMSKAMLGFSPTVWSSGNRTNCFLIFALICCCVIVIEVWDYSNRKTRDALCLCLVIPAVGGVIGNVLAFF